MKKLKLLVISLITMFISSSNVIAASGTLSISSNSVYVGNTFTVNVKVNSVAAWNIHVSASGPVSGCLINQADATADAMDTNKSFSATCTATGLGTITITLSGDVTSASDGNAVSVSGSKNVTVLQKPVIPPSNNNNNSNNVDVRSKNNNLKELIADGYELTKVDYKNYSLSVSNDVDSINIIATPEDSKAKIVGTGVHQLNVGENNIEVVVIAENGAQNKINIKIVRKDGYYIDDLDSLLEKNDADVLDIIVYSDTKITAKDFEKIKNSGKTVKFNYYNDNKILVYSWIINGKTLKKVNGLNTTIINDSKNKKDILRLSNYADGLFVGIEQTNNMMESLKLRLFVGEKYEDNDAVRVYAYLKDSNELKMIASQIKVENGYIEFETANAYDYFITMSNIPGFDKTVTSDNKSEISIITIINVVLSVLVISLLLIFIIKKRKRKDNLNISSLNNNLDEQNNEIHSNDNSNLFN